MRPGKQNAEAVHQDIMALQRVLRRAELNTTRPKDKNLELQSLVKKALHVLLLDESSSGASSSPAPRRKKPAA